MASSSGWDYFGGDTESESDDEEVHGNADQVKSVTEGGDTGKTEGSISSLPKERESMVTPFFGMTMPTSCLHIAADVPRQRAAAQPRVRWG